MIYLFIDLIYPCELKLKDRTESSVSASNLECYLFTDNGKLFTRLHDKSDDFNFPKVNFQFFSSNIPPASAYRVYVFQLVRYAKSC